MRSPESDGTIDGDERRLGARTVGPDPACQDVLPGATLASQQHDGVGGRRPSRGLQETEKGRTARLEERRLAALVQFLLEFGQPPSESLRFDDATGGQPDLIGRERLRHVVDGAALDRR